MGISWKYLEKYFIYCHNTADILSQRYFDSTANINKIIDIWYLNISWCTFKIISPYLPTRYCAPHPVLKILSPMDFAQSRNQSPSQLPASSSKYHHPYFTPAEVEYLSDKQRGKFSATQDEKTRQTACGFLEAMGARIGLYVSSCHIESHHGLKRLLHQP
jgi:hypothetical protein